MKKTIDWVSDLLKLNKDHSLDGQIVSVFESYIHVRLKGGNRRLITHVVIADHIDVDKLKPGRYCKISRLHDRGEGQTGKFILTDILPIPDNDGVSVTSEVLPDETRLNVTLDCVGAAWSISWDDVTNAISYILYKAQDQDGLNQTQVVETTNLTFAFPFIVDGFAFFAVEVVGSNGNSELSDWTTDLNYFTDTGIIAFGDDDLHGDIIDIQTRFVVRADGVYKSTNEGVSWVAVTPTTVFNDWGDISDLTEINYTQIISTESLCLVFGNWENASSEKQGWFWSSEDLGETWTNHTIRWNTETEAFPIWASLGDTDLYLTIFADDEIILQEYDIADIVSGPTQEIGLGTPTRSEVEAKTTWAFPVWVTTDEIYIAGRFTSVVDAAIAHIDKLIPSGPTWSLVVDDWGADVCTSLKIELSDTDRLFYATRETL